MTVVVHTSNPDERFEPVEAEAWPEVRTQSPPDAPLRSALIRALALVREEIQSGARVAGDRLPPVRWLSRQARVSNAVMCSALGILQREGIVSVVKNRGFFIGAPPAKSDAASIPTEHWLGGQRWQRLKVKIENDIYSGRFPAGRNLPSLRDLALAYAVSYKPLRKSLDSMIAEGVLHPYKKTFRVPEARCTHAALVFMTTADAAAKMSYGGFPYREFLSALIREGAKKMIHVAHCRYHPDRRVSCLADQLRELQDRQSVLGTILWSSHIPPRALDQVLGVLRRLRQEPGVPGISPRPVAVVDATLDMAVTRVLRREADKGDPAFRVFGVADLTAGRQVGQYLLKRDHRKVAFLSYCHHELWSQLRWGGLFRAFRNAGFESGLRKFVINASDNHNPPSSPAGLADFWKQAQSFLVDSANSDRHTYAAYALEQLRASVENYVHHLVTADCLEPMLGAVLQEPGLTACVAANDRLALLVRDFLVRKGVRVPRDISVIGFDDSKTASDNNLTSFNFAFDEIARAVLAYVLDPQSRPGRKCDWAECEGSLVERASSGGVAIQ